MNKYNLLHAGGIHHKFSLVFDKEANNELAEENGEREARKIFISFWENMPGSTFYWLKRYFNELDKNDYSYGMVPYEWMKPNKSW